MQNIMRRTTMQNIMKKFERSSLGASSRRLRRARASRGFFALRVESLETRQMLTAGIAIVTAIPVSSFTATSTNLLDAQHGPLAIFGSQVVSIYKTYAADFAAAVRTGNTSAAAADALATRIEAQFPKLQVQGSSVNMSINSLGGDFNAFLAKLQSLGMQVTVSSADYGIVQGWVPIAALPTIATLPQTEAGHAVTAATTHALTGFQGKAYNEPGTALGADAARSQFGLDGTGVTIGVLSDSVNSIGNGLADSYATGDLLASQVTVIPGQAGNAHDEGRAMMESIHDIAPGAKLQFAKGGDGDLGFMQNIEALYAAGSKIIVDDISQGDEPYFQDGLIAQAVDYVTARGDLYFTSAANSGADNGYLAPFRELRNVTVGSGTSAITGSFQNFNGNTNGTASPLLKITTGIDNSFINFQFDQPFKTQEPVGATATPTSSLSFLVYDANGHLVLDNNMMPISGTDNNVATHQPYQGVNIPTQGTYFVAIQLVSGPAPGHVEFVGLGNDGAVQVDKTLSGSAGNTYYPSSEGHETTVAAIGVGTTAWYNPAPFQNNGIATPVAESSSTGPGLIEFSPKGTPIIPTLVQNPAITAADGGTTTFFGQTGIDTSLFGGTPYDLTPTPQKPLFDFFGTSQAAPNAAAVAALMLQDVPTLNRVQILQAMEMSATPINNVPKGTYNIQSGYGLLNAVAAINAIKPPTLAASTVAGSSSVATPTAGVAFNLTATLTGGSGTPTGTVDFYDISYNTDLSPSPVALVGGVATISVNTSDLGSHIYLLTYNGNGTYAKSTAYVLLDVVSGGSQHSIRIQPIGSPVSPPVSIPTTVIVPLLIDSRMIDDLAVGILSSTTAGRTARARKFTI